MSWEEIYSSKLATPEDAIKLIRSGDRVVTSFGCCEPKGLERVLIENYKDYKDFQ